MTTTDRGEHGGHGEQGEPGEHGRYVYAVCRAPAPASVASLPGLLGASLEIVDHGDLSAVASTVPLAEFGEEGLRRNLEDLPWLEQVARTHDDVVTGVSQEVPTAPMRLATIFTDDASVAARLAERHDEILEVLDRIAGRREWSVKVLHQGSRGTGGEPGERPASGAEYLLRKREDARRRASADADASVLADEVYDRLAQASVASRRLAPQDPQLSGLPGTMTLNAAFLVEEGDEGFAEELSAVEALAADGDVRVGGPWPPYSFAALDSM